MIYDANIDPTGLKVKVERVIGYKVVQEWFHNIFNTSWCSTPWLHEAFITFMGAYAMDKVIFMFLKLLINTLNACCHMASMQKRS